MTSIQTTSTLTVTGSTQPTQTPIGPAALTLPPAAMGDAAAVALFASFATNDTKIRGATQSLEIAESQRQSAIKAAKEALRRAREAEQDGGFWSKVGKIAAAAAVVAGAAGAVFTGGSSAVVGVAIAGALLSSASFAMKELDVDVELVEVGGIKLNLSDAFALGGAACTSGASAAATSTSGARVAKLVAGGADAAATGVQAGAKYGESQALGEMLDHEADATAHTNRADNASDQAEGEIAMIEQIMEEKRKAMDAIASILNSQQAANAAIARRLA